MNPDVTTPYTVSSPEEQTSAQANLEREKSLDSIEEVSQPKNAQTNTNSPFAESKALAAKALSTTLNFFLGLIDFCEERRFLIFLLLIVWLGWSSLCKTGQNIADELFNSRYLNNIKNAQTTNGDRKIEDYLQKFNTQKFQGSEPGLVKVRLKEQITEIERRADNHFSMTKYFYRQFFVSVIMSSVAAVVAAVSLFSISKTGWSNKDNSRTTTIFIVASGTTILFSSFIFVFKFDENISQNKKLYLAYTALEDRVFSYLATGEFSKVETNITTQTELKNTNKTTGSNVISESNPVKIVHDIDGELAALNDIAIGFDTGKIPNYQDFQKLSNQASPETP